MRTGISIINHCHIVAGDPVATKVKRGDLASGGKLDTYVVGFPETPEADPGPVMVVRRNFNGTTFHNDFGTARTVGVSCESLAPYPGLVATIRPTASGTAHLQVSDPQGRVAAVIPLGLSAPQGDVARDVRSVAWQQNVDEKQGFLTLDGKTTYRVQDGKLEPVQSTGVEWWARDQRGFLRQDG